MFKFKLHFGAFKPQMGPQLPSFPIPSSKMEFATLALVALVFVSSSSGAVHKVSLSAKRAALSVDAPLELPKSIRAQLPGDGRFGAGEQPLREFHGLLLYGTVGVGQPAQSLQLGFPFHHNQMWVFAENGSLPTNRVHHHVKKFKQSQSGTFVQGSLDFRLPYRLATGKYATDSVQLAGQTYELQFGVVNSASRLYGLLPIDGQFGIGPAPVDNQGIESPLNKVFSQLQRQQVSVWIDSQSVLLEGNAAITFGGLDEDNCNGDWGFVPMTDNGGWHFGLNSVTVGGKDTYQMGAEKVRISDENHVIVGPHSQVSNILLPIGAQPGHLGSWWIDCDRQHSAPDLTFNLGPEGSVKVTVKARQYIVAVPKMKQCVLTVMSYPDPIKSFGWVVGETFYDGRCMALDWEKKQIGFATAR